MFELFNNLITSKFGERCARLEFSEPSIKLQGPLSTELQPSRANRLGEPLTTDHLMNLCCILHD